jgi:hypothetical protein
LPDREALREEPDERLTREAYLDTPLIEDARAREIERGASRAEVFERLGRSRVGYPRGLSTCFLYPIRGTERRDAFGSPAADEWEFCFGAADELVVRRRISRG